MGGVKSFDIFSYRSDSSRNPACGKQSKPRSLRVPKEITHWKIALKAAFGLNDESFGQLLEKKREVYLLGAVLPDLPYYYLAGSKLGEMMALAEHLHLNFGETEV